jgi:hypothetical protein
MLGCGTDMSNFVDEIQRELNEANRGPMLIRSSGCFLIGVVCLFVPILIIAFGILLAGVLS